MAFSIQTLNLVGKTMVRIVKEELAEKKYTPAGFYGQEKKYKSPTDKIASGDLYNSVEYEIINRGNGEYQDWVIEIQFPGNEEKAFYVDRGSRSPFRARPPKDSISAWIDSRGISVPGLTKEQLTFAIMNSVKQKGIQPTGFIRSSEDRMIKELSQILEQEAVEDIEEILDQIIIKLNKIE
jgi:hypothetical protein